MTYYVFDKGTNRFIKISSKTLAVTYARVSTYEVFRQEPGIPNPWWVRKVSEDGSLGNLHVHKEKSK